MIYLMTDAYFALYLMQFSTLLILDLSMTDTNFAFCLWSSSSIVLISDYSSAGSLWFIRSLAVYLWSEGFNLRIFVCIIFMCFRILCMAYTKWRISRRGSQVVQSCSSHRWMEWGWCISWQNTYIITWVRTYDEHAVTEQSTPHKTQMIGYCDSILSWRHTCSEVLMLYVFSDTIAESLVLSSHLVLGYNLILIISIQCFQTLRTSIVHYELFQGNFLYGLSIGASGAS